MAGFAKVTIILDTPQAKTTDAGLTVCVENVYLLLFVKKLSYFAIVRKISIFATESEGEILDLEGN